MYVVSAIPGLVSREEFSVIDGDFMKGILLIEVR